MINNKKIKARLEAERKSRQARYIQIAGAAIVLFLVALWIGSLAKGGSEPVQETSSAGESAPKSKEYDAYPPMTIDTAKKYSARIVMAKGGEFTVELYADKAPLTVNSFVFLARDGYFDGVTFHRVLDGFMAQAGDPTGTGTGGPGYQFEYEANDLKFDKPGVMAMANKGAQTATNGSQFFITFDATPQLDGGYTIFGQVIEGMDVVNGITRRDPNDAPNFAGDVIETVVITEE